MAPMAIKSVAAKDVISVKRILFNTSKSLTVVKSSLADVEINIPAIGASGAQGPAGAKGDRGDAGGGGGGGSLSYGAGEVSVGTCSDSATVGLKAKFTSGDFVFDTITVSDLNTDCGGLTFKYYFEIKATGSLHNSTGEYANGATIECTFAIPASGTWGTSPQFSIGSGNSTCTNLTAPAGTFLLNKISTADYTDAIGFEIT